MKRLENVSEIKGIMIILVVFGHVFPGISRNNVTIDYMWNFIYNFHMIPFFAISGMLYYNSQSKKSLATKNFLIKKAKLLLIPYLVFSLVNYTIINVLHLLPPFKSLMEKAGYHSAGIMDVIYSTMTYQNHVDQHLWFIYVLFIIFVMIKVSEKLIKNDYLQLFLFSIISFCGSYISNPEIIKLSLMYSFYFYLGKYLLKNWTILTSLNIKYKLSSILVFFIINGALSFIEVTFPHSTTNMIFRLSKYANGVLSLVVIVSVINLGIFTLKGLKKVLTKIGDYSYDIYLLHQPFLVSGISGILFVKNINLLLVSPVITVIGVVVPIFFSRLFIQKSNVLSNLFLGRNKSQVSRQKTAS